MTTTEPRAITSRSRAAGRRHAGPAQAAWLADGSAADGRAAGCLPIAEHGLIGELHTVAIVGTGGAIDWFCCPRFNPSSVFAAILDAKCGAYWRIAPEGAANSRQMYLPDTNVLLTRFSGLGGVVEVADLVPVTVSQPYRSRLIRR